MKKAVFYIQIGKKEEIRFGNPFNALPPETICFDIDNHSDNVTMQYAHGLLEDSETIVLLLHQHSLEPLGMLTGFFEKVIRKRKATFTAYSIGELQLPAGLLKHLSPAKITAEGIEAMLIEGMK